MALSLFRLNPAKPSYSVSDTSAILRSQKSGPSYFGVRQLNNVLNLQTMWETDREGFKYARAFWRTTIVVGSLPFMARLVFFQPTLTKHVVQFVPGSFGLAGFKGTKYTLQGTLEVAPDIIP